MSMQCMSVEAETRRECPSCSQDQLHPGSALSPRSLELRPSALAELGALAA